MKEKRKPIKKGLKNKDLTFALAEFLRKYRRFPKVTEFAEELGVTPKAIRYHAQKRNPPIRIVYKTIPHILSFAFVIFADFKGEIDFDGRPVTITK
jgi:predicted transcriptional regulator